MAIIQYNVASNKEIVIWVVSCYKQTFYDSNYSIWNYPAYLGKFVSNQLPQIMWSAHLSTAPTSIFWLWFATKVFSLSNAAQSPWTVCKRFKYTTMFQHVPTEIVIVSKQTYWCFLCPDGSFPTHFVAGGIAPGSLPVTSCEILIFCNGLTRCV